MRQLQPELMHSLCHMVSDILWVLMFTIWKVLEKTTSGIMKRLNEVTQFGTAFLRFALPYKPGHVFTVEPGCYFIPELIEMWKAEGKFKDFINYSKIDKYMSIGGIRIEDDVLITEKGHKVLGKPIPKTVKEVESVCS